VGSETVSIATWFVRIATTRVSVIPSLWAGAELIRAGVLGDQRKPDLGR